MLQRLWSKLAVVLGRRAVVVGIVIALITVVLGLGTTRLEFATGQDSYLNKGDQIAKDNEAYQELFGGQIMIVMFSLHEDVALSEFVTTNEAVFDDVFDELCGELVDDECTAQDTIKSVVSPMDGLQLAQNLLLRDSNDPTTDAAIPTESIAGKALGDAIAAEEDGSPEKLARTQDQDLTACRLLGIDNPLSQTPAEERSSCTDHDGFALEGNPLALDPEKATLSNPEWIDFVLRNNDGTIRRSLETFFPDEEHATMIVRLTGNASIEIEGEGADAVKAAWADRDLEGAEVTVTGAPALLKDLNDYLRGGLLQLGGIAVAMMALLLIFLFRVRWRLLPLGVVLIACVWTFGLAGYLSIPLSVVTIAGLPVLLGMGIDYAIQMHARIDEEVRIDRAAHPIQEAARELAPGLVAVTVVAIIAFMSLQRAEVPMIRAFGLLLSVGIFVVLLCSLIIPMAALGSREFHDPTEPTGDAETPLGSTVRRLGGLPSKLAIPFIAASSLILLLGLAVEPKLQLQTDVVEWVDQQSVNRKAVGRLYDELDISSELGTYIVADDQDTLFSDELIAWVDEYTDSQLERYPNQLARASSIVTPMSYLLDIPGGSDIPPTGDQVRKTYEVAPDSIRAFTVVEDRAALNVLHVTRPGPLRDLSDVVDNTRRDAGPGGEEAPPADVRATPSGLAVVGVGLLQNLENGRAVITYIALGAAFIFLTLRLRSLIRGVLCLVPLLIATGTASIAAYVLDLKLSPMTAVGGPIVIAACAEFTTLILLRFVEERRRGLTPQAASDVAASRTGAAFVLSALTTVVGIGVIATSSLPILRDFGIVVALNVVVALLSALVVLPPILVWADQRRWVSRGLVPDDVLDRANRTSDAPDPHTADIGGAGPRPAP